LYSYVRNDPVNFTDPLGLYEACAHAAMTEFLAKLAGLSDDLAADLGKFTGDGPGGADSKEFAATGFKNMAKWVIGKGTIPDIHFASEKRLSSMKASFQSYIDSGNIQQAGFVLHAIEDVHGAHQGIGGPIGHAIRGHKPDRNIGDKKFINAANEVMQVLTGNSSAQLTGQDINKLIDAIVARCKQELPEVELQTTTRPVPSDGSGGGGGGGGRIGGGRPGWTSLDILHISFGTSSIGIGSYPKIKLPK
jgi:hypothetical protein